MGTTVRRRVRPPDARATAMSRSPEAQRAYDRAKYERNRAALKARTREYHSANREAVATRMALYYNRNRSTLLAKQTARRQTQRPERCPASPPTPPAPAPSSAPTTPRPIATATPTMLIGVLDAKPLPGREPGPPPKTPSSRPAWVPTPVHTEITPRRTPTSYLCSCGNPFPSKEQADRHERTHDHAASITPLGPHREVSVLGL
jgi:hypothetical protein